MSKAWADRTRADYNRYRRVVRPAVFARDGGRCQLALPGEWRTRTGEVRRCLGVADQVHHTHGMRATGLLDMRYMKAACAPCNYKVGDPTKVPDPPHVRSGWLQ